MDEVKTGLRGHAKLFFPDFKPASIKDSSLLDGLRASDSQTGEYLCYVLLDFVTADPELEDVPLAAALVMSRELGLDAQWEKIVVRELKRKPRDVRKLKDEWLSNSLKLCAGGAIR